MISSTYTPATFNGNSSTTTFGIPSDFNFGGTDTLNVYTKVTSTGVITKLILGTDYTIVGSNVICTVAPPTGDTITLELIKDNLQSSGYAENGPIPSATLEGNLDKLTMEVQTISDTIKRMPKADGTVSLTGFSPVIQMTPTYVLTVNAAGNGFQTVPATDVTGALLASNNLSELTATASTARTNLGLGTASVQNAGYFAQVANNLSDLASASTARTNLGLGTLATQSGTFSGTSSGTNTGDQNLFASIPVAGQTTITTSSPTQALTFAAGSNITLTTNNTTKTLTITGSAGGIAAVVDDTSPMLGGNLDLNGNSIVSGANLSIHMSSSTILNVNVANVVCSTLLYAPHVNANTMNVAGITATPGTVLFFEAPNNGSNTITLTPSASLSASYTLTLPSATDTLVGKATTDTLTNKTIDAASNTISDLTTSNLSSSAGILADQLAAMSVSDVVVTDGSGFLTTSSVSTTTLGYLDATSSIQTQLNSKASYTWASDTNANNHTITNLQGITMEQGNTSPIVWLSSGGASITLSPQAYNFTNNQIIQFKDSGGHYGGYIATDSNSITLTNKTIDASSNTVTGFCLPNDIAKETIDGRITPHSGNPVYLYGTNLTSFYYTPYKGNQIGLYNGTSWDLLTFTEITYTVPSTSNTMYDLFAYNNSGTVTLTQVAWTNDQTRATALTYQDGVLVLSGTPTRRYLGSFRTTGTSGQTELTGSNMYIWNYYNRVTFGGTLSASSQGIASTYNITGAALGSPEIVGGNSTPMSFNIISGGYDNEENWQVHAGGFGYDATLLTSGTYSQGFCLVPSWTTGSYFNLDSNTGNYPFLATTGFVNSVSDVTYARTGKYTIVLAEYCTGTGTMTIHTSDGTGGPTANVNYLCWC